MMTDPEQLLRELAESTRSAPPPKVDVRDRVMDTISARSQVLPPDPVPLAFCGFAIALAASVVFVYLPLWHALSEPWACYSLL
ncbi:MAG: hypothetical protein KDB27_32145 [Planctomycetales bacterium]|nr:hypothetical protein [Planctomycetales bacterium]